jgi:hypothetical protein
VYYNSAPGLVWATDDLINDAIFAPEEDAPLTAYQPGQHYRVSFGEAALGPAMVAERLGNQALFLPALFSGSEPGHTAYDVDGDSLVQTTLALGHTVIGTATGPVVRFTLPAASHLYTLTEQATRPASWSVLGTKAAVTWHFHSAASTALSVSSLLAVRVSGPFSLHDSAPAGQAVPLRLAVESGSGQVTTLRLAVSYDDGTTWHSARLTRAGGHWTASAGSPKGASFVSLRISAADSAGDSVTSTMIRAYALG